MLRLPLCTLVLVLLLPLQALAADLFIAQAANFMPAMEEIVPLFEAETGLEVDVTYGSTGKLYGQITNGAPYDLFLAADERRPATLFADGLCSAPFVYAQGQVVFFAANQALCGRTWQEAVLDPAAAKVAIANTETAPYGTSAMQAMQNAGVWDAVQDKLVFGQSIAQAFQFVTSGGADAGFCAYSSMFTDEARAGCYTVVEQAPPILQAACVLASAPHPEAAARFVEFLSTPAVQAIKEAYGYR